MTAHPTNGIKPVRSPSAAALVATVLVATGTVWAQSAAPSVAPPLVAAHGPTVAEATAQKIRALGPTPTVKQISAVVHAAVGAAPDAVLEIVQAAVQTSPIEAVEEIAASAVSALPDPWKPVRYARGRTKATVVRDFKGEPDFKGGPVERPSVEAPGDGQMMTLAEAVIQAALDARTGLSGPSIVAAVEAVLRGAPGWMLISVTDPRGISGVGDVGNNNYANEPGRRRRVILGPTNPPGSSSGPRVPPTPPPVSP